MFDPVLRPTLSRFGDQHEGIVSLYLFGSRSEGREHRESDTDIAVLLDRAVYQDRRARFDARLRLTTRLIESIHSNDVDLVVLNDAPPQLAHGIITRGQRLFCRDLDIDHAFVRTTLLRAADLTPFLERARRIKLAALAR